ncbi:MAG: circularly permuted type 2 ATP-grasp protein [Gordonia sp. (in: high G+C Gram-positive bacteria)]|uniref:circularly permuted type 2 ATP-grasp protein n=1 Tax=Gordonia sp. (in: high G+C Gram-positive bacteria) TaxID=84139 RepID=UPI0039E48674
MTSAPPTAGHADASTGRSVFSGYPPAGRTGDRYDELYDDAGAVRPQWDPVVDRLRELGESGARRLGTRVGELVDDDDLTYNVPTDDDDPDAPPHRTVRWRLDALPMVISPEEWDRLARALAQRSLLLDMLLKDFYGAQRTLREQLVPPELVFGHPGFVRRAVGVRVPGARSLFLHATDVGRLADGSFAAFADHTQAPSGIGYALAGRRVMSRALPIMYRGVAPRSLSSFAQNLRLALLDAAPPDAGDPTLVLMSPGAASETAFDQATLASALGLPLVEADDLTMRSGGLYMRSLGRMKRVDVVLRRVDAEYTDPLDLRADSRLGVPGLVELMTRGAVGVVNTLGSGLLENPALHAYLPDLCRALLDEDLLLPSAPSYHFGTARGRAALDDLDDLVLTHLPSGERVVGPRLTAPEREQVRARIDADPASWCARRLVEVSQVPSMVPGDRVVTARGFSLRAFTVAQESGYKVLSGGLGHVLAGGLAGRLLHSSAAKDVWVPVSEEVRSGVRVSTVPSRRTVSAAVPAVTPRMLSNMFWMGRYADRAEVLVRLLAVARERDEFYRNRPWQLGSRALQPLLDTVYSVAGAPTAIAPLRAEGPNATDVLAGLTSLTADTHVAGTVGYAVAALAEAARAVRDQMSVTTWSVLSGGERALAALAATEDDDGVRLDETLTELLVSLLAFAGLAHEALVRDAGWLMMDVGRRIERTLGLAEMTRGTVVPVSDPDTESALVDAYLVAGESSVTYRRLYPGPARPRTAMALMLFDDTNPRSAVFQLTALRTSLSGLPDELRSGPAERIVEELITALRRFDTDDVDVVDDDRRAELERLLDTLRDGLHEVSDVLERTRFAPPVAARPLWAGTVPGGPR